MRASRLLAILILLQLRRRVTAADLAEEFEVSVRTIYRDIDALSASGVPVYGDRGPGGGFQLLEGYRTHLTGVGKDEAEALFLIGMPGPATSLGLGRAAESAARKLVASLPPALRRDGGHINARFHLDPIDWYRATEPVPHLPVMARAVLDQCVVEMAYESWSGERLWIIHPLGLVLKAGAWYVAGKTDDRVRIFKVANVRRLDMLTARFERPPDFDLAAWWADELERFEHGLRPETAVLNVSSEGQKRIVALGAYAAQAVSAAVPVGDDGWARVTLPIESVDDAARLMLGIGPEIEILEPRALRAKVRALAMEMVRLAEGEAET
jgi:predicted DNA-binding transcriptional regulator YafY